MFKDIDTALSWVMKRRNETKDFNTFKALMESLDNPQDKFKTIHVAGTNGKGSTVTYLRDIFMANGYHVGTLQSPHFLTHLDRIRYDGKNIEEDIFLSILNKYYDFIVEHNLNMFEIDFIIMCEYFKMKKIDVAIIEVGIGGRLDSTNVINRPLLSIITTIGYDHMDRLGNTLELICKEKCGIIKNNSKVLVGELSGNLKDIVKEKAALEHSTYYELDNYKKIRSQYFIYKGKEYQISSMAIYQLHNAALALKAYEIMDYENDEEKTKKALYHSKWNGRFDIVRENPRVILDGAHNIDGVKALSESIKGLKGTKAVLFGALKTKEYQKMIKELEKVADRIVFTGFSHPLALKKEDYQGYEYVDDFKKAYEILLKEYDNIIIAGSLYFISDFASSNIL